MFQIKNTNHDALVVYGREPQYRLQIYTAGRCFIKWLGRFLDRHHKF